jgi:hypothetical protein
VYPFASFLMGVDFTPHHKFGKYGVGGTLRCWNARPGMPIRTHASIYYAIGHSSSRGSAAALGEL